SGSAGRDARPRPLAPQIPQAPPQAAGRRNGPSLPLLPLVPCEILARGAKATERRGKAAIDSGMQQDLADLLLGYAVPDCPVQMQLELLGLAECDQHRDVEHAAYL